MVRISLHNHTKDGGFYKGASSSKHTLPSYVEFIKALDKYNIKIAAITDHNYDGAVDDILWNGLPGYEVSELDNRGVIVQNENMSPKYIFRGAELMTPFHTLVIGHNRSLEIEPYKENDINELVSKVWDADIRGGMCIVAHPFNKRFGGAPEEQLEKLLDTDLVRAIEIYNPQNAPPFFNKFNKKSKDFAREKKIPGVATADLHVIRDIPLGYINMRDGDLDYSSGTSLLRSLEENITENNFKNHEGNNLLQLIRIGYYQPASYVISKKGRKAFPRMLKRFSKK